MPEMDNGTTFNCTDHTSIPILHPIKAPLFWVSVAVSVILAILSIIGNGIVIYVAGRKKNTGTLRYLNNAVRSLAVTDLVIGLIGIPLMIVYYYWDLIDYTKCVDDHGGVRLEALWMIPNIMTTSNCLHVALLVFLRMVAIEKPLKYEEVHKKFRRVAIIIIWIFSIIVCSLPVISAPFSKQDHNTTTTNDTTTITFNQIARVFTLHGCHTLPLCLILIMYIRLVWMLQKSVNRISSGKELSELPQNARINMLNKKKQLSRMLAGVVTCLVVCYVPFLVQWHIDITVDRNTSEISTPWIIFTWIARCLMQINCCVNPFIYASTIPQFMQVVKDIFNGKYVGNVQRRMAKRFTNDENTKTRKSNLDTSMALQNMKNEEVGEGASTLHTI